MTVTLAVLILAVALLAVICGCAGTGGTDGEPAETPGPPEPPPAASLDTPEDAVDAYLASISYAYRILDSSVAQEVLGPWEEVRVDSYVELNRQEGRAIDQRLLSFEIREVERGEPTSTVVAHEDWAYRYISTTTGEYSSEELTASYDATYIVIREDDGLWRVHEVDVRAIGAVE